MNGIAGFVLAVSSSLAASIAAKATIILVLGLAASWLARGSRAAVRHTLLAAMFAILLALPVASLVESPVRIQVAAQRPAVTAPVPAAVSVVPGESTAPAMDVAPATPARTGVSPAVWMLSAWMAGVAVFLAPVVVGLWQVRRLRRTALPWIEGRKVAASLTKDAGTGRSVDVLLHEAIPGPMTCGVAHPAIVLSQDAPSWEAHDLNRALLHELEHVRRADWASHIVARAVCALYWFNPLVWMAWRRFALEAERACDDAVLAQSESTAYADQLVCLAQRLSAVKTPLLAMANRADLATRVNAVLDTRQRRGRAGKLPVALTCAVAAVVVVAMSPLKVVAVTPAAAIVLLDAPPSPIPAAPAPLVPAVSIPPAASQSVAASQPAHLPRFQSSSALVIVTATVTDPNGDSIAGLTANDFSVTEDGVAQRISIFDLQQAAAVIGTQSMVVSYYVLGYYTANPNTDGNFRKIQIGLKHDSNAVVRSRTGYYSSPVAAVEAAVTGVPGQPMPILLRKKEPEYSDEARKAKYQGTVILGAEIDTAGRVTNLQVIRSLGLGLDEKAIEAVSQWKFKPGMKDGNPVATQVQLEVNFRLM